MMSGPATKADLDELAQATQAAFVKVDHRFDSIEGQLGGVEGRLDGVESRLENVEIRLDKADRVQAAILTTVQAIEQRLTSWGDVGKRLDRLEERVFRR